MYLCLPPCFCFLPTFSLSQTHSGRHNPCCVAWTLIVLGQTFSFILCTACFSLLRRLSCFTCRQPASLFSHKGSCLLLFYPVLVLLSGLADLRKRWHLTAYTYETLVLRFHSLSLYSVAQADLIFLPLPSKLELKVCTALHSFLILLSLTPSVTSFLASLLASSLIPFCSPFQYLSFFQCFCLSFWDRVSCTLVEPWIMDPSKCWGITDMLA